MNLLIVSADLCVCCEWSVASHEEVKLRGWNERGNQTNQVIVHVAWITKSCSAGSHYGGYLAEKITQRKYNFTEIEEFKLIGTRIIGFNFQTV